MVLVIVPKWIPRNQTCQISTRTPEASSLKQTMQTRGQPAGPKDAARAPLFEDNKAAPLDMYCLPCTACTCPVAMLSCQGYYLLTRTSQQTCIHAPQNDILRHWFHISPVGLIYLFQLIHASVHSPKQTVDPRLRECS